MATSYVYKWTHKPTQKWYIGSRTNKTAHPDDGYICSSQIVKPLILANPTEWERKIIATGSSKEMRQKEQQLLKLYNAAKNHMSYNRSNWGGPVEGSGRKKGTTEKIKASVILAELDKVCYKLYGTNFMGHIVEDYAKAKQNNDKKYIKQLETIFLRKKLTITYNGNKIYDYRNYLTE
jgi:hypothetical protein